MAEPPTTANLTTIKSSIRRVHTYKLPTRRRRKARWWFLKYGSMMRCLIDTECRQVNELEHTHKLCTARKVSKHTGNAGREVVVGLRFPLDYDTTQHAHAQQLAKRRGDTERSRERGFGGFPDYNTTQHPHAQKIIKGSGDAERSGEGGSVVSHDYDTTQHAHVHNKPSAVEKKRE